MGNAIFPRLPGQAIEVDRSPAFLTKVQRSVSGRELRASYASTPIWSFTLSYEFLRSDPAYGELQVLQGFFLARRGSWDSFLYSDPSDHQVANELIGTGDGANRFFQLTRAFGGFAEPVASIESIATDALMWSQDSDAPMWHDDGISMWTAGPDYTDDDFTRSPTGLLTFEVAPPPGLPIYWTGSYYYRCRFKDDLQGYSQFLRRVWSAKKVEFVGSLGTKL